MAFLTELWLPILLSAVFVFIVSSIVHMATPLHKSDLKKMPNEEDVMAALRAAGVQPGAYMMPCGDSMADWSTPEMVAKREKGPLGWVTITTPSGFNMFRSLIVWFLHSLLIGVFVAYIGWYALGRGATGAAVWRIVGAVAILGYAIGHIHDATWKGQTWWTTSKFIFGGLLYAATTAATFAWLWPQATA